MRVFGMWLSTFYTTLRFLRILATDLRPVMIDISETDIDHDRMLCVYCLCLWLQFVPRREQSVSVINISYGEILSCMYVGRHVQ